MKEFPLPNAYWTSIPRQSPSGNCNEDRKGLTAPLHIELHLEEQQHFHLQKMISHEVQEGKKSIPSSSRGTNFTPFNIIPKYTKTSLSFWTNQKSFPKPKANDCELSMINPCLKNQRQKIETEQSWKIEMEIKRKNRRDEEDSSSKKFQRNGEKRAHHGK